MLFSFEEHLDTPRHVSCFPNLCKQVFTIPGYLSTERETCVNLQKDIMERYSFVVEDVRVQVELRFRASELSRTFLE